MPMSDSHTGAGLSAFRTCQSAVPDGNGKTQDWKPVWPPTKPDMAGVAEARGQMLLLDGTGGSGTTAVPNAVALPPKSAEQKLKEQQAKAQQDKARQEEREQKQPAQ